MYANLKFTLREASGSDDSFVEKLMRITSPHIMPESMLWDDDNHRHRVLAQLNTAVIIEVSGGDIGFFQLAYSSVEIHIMQIRILPEWRCRGIGTRMLKTLQVMCAKTKVPLALHVDQDNRAMGLYCRLGFKVVKSDATAHLMRWWPSA